MDAAVGSVFFLSSRVTSRLDALATWIEPCVTRGRPRGWCSYRVHGAIRARQPAANIEAWSSGSSRAHHGSGVRRLASELADASADEAIAPLILAARFGGADLQNLLGTAAANTREQLALVQRTEVARAKPRGRCAWSWW